MLQTQWVSYGIVCLGQLAYNLKQTYIKEVLFEQSKFTDYSVFTKKISLFALILKIV